MTTANYDVTSRQAASSIRKTVAAALLVAVTGAVIIGLTSTLSDQTYLASLAPQRRNIITAELAVFSIILVELIGSIILQHFKRQHARELGIAIRAIFRVIAYMALAIAIISLLAASPALAVGVGGMMGLVVAFSTQNIIANVFAGMFIAIGRPFTIGDEITVMGSTGRVLELGVMHTQIDIGERVALIPNASMLTQAILRTKRLPPSSEV